MKLPVEIPKPSRFVSHSAVDLIADAVSQFCANSGVAFDGDAIDVEDFLGNTLGKELVWDRIDEPDQRICFATLSEDKVVLNEKHAALFDEKPFLLRSCLAHEAGHIVLRHTEISAADINQQDLFGEEAKPALTFHDSALKPNCLSRYELRRIKNKVALKAAINLKARKILASLEDKLEPNWMFWQAEQFSSCFLIPLNRLDAYLSNGIDITDWPSLYRMAEHFEVSISMVCTRLEKLKLITIEGTHIRIVPKTPKLIV